VKHLTLNKFVVDTKFRGTGEGEKQLRTSGHFQWMKRRRVNVKRPQDKWQENKPDFMTADTAAPMVGYCQTRSTFHNSTVDKIAACKGSMPSHLFNPDCSLGTHRGAGLTAGTVQWIADAQLFLVGIKNILWTYIGTCTAARAFVIFYNRHVHVTRPPSL
jgi:hypothetical protein